MRGDQSAGTHLANNSSRRNVSRAGQAAAAVVHPHVLAIHHVQPNGRLPFLVMPLVAGESLAERLKPRDLDLREILRIGMQAAAGWERRTTRVWSIAM